VLSAVIAGGGGIELAAAADGGLFTGGADPAGLWAHAVPTLRVKIRSDSADLFIGMLLLGLQPGMRGPSIAD